VFRRFADNVADFKLGPVMSNNYVTVAGFSQPVDAEIARGRLESEGIPAVVMGGLSTSTLFGTSNIAGRVDLRVPGEHVARAVQILAECGDAGHLTDENAGPFWICPLCGEPVGADLSVCPSCETHRGQTPLVRPEDDDEAEEGIQLPPPSLTRVTAQPTEWGLATSAEAASEASSGIEPETDIELPPLTTMVGDAMARRAFYAALFGPAAAGLLSLYSMWLLLKLTFYHGELSARGMRHLYLALLLNTGYMLLFCLLCGGLPR
jgi:Putative prokaryotic signal transducing protein